MKLGYIHGKHARLKLHNYLVGAGAGLPDPPVHCDWSLALLTDPEMLGNDSVGDCTAADLGHVIMCNTANGDGQITPTTEQTIAAYSGYSGYQPGNEQTDVGATLSQAADYAARTGICDQKLDAYLDIQDSRPRVIKQVIWLFGSCSIGVRLPQSAMTAFDAGKPWTETSDINILGGHDVPLVGYTADGPVCITWGKIQPMSWAWLAMYAVEYQARLWFDRIAASVAADPNGLKLDQLRKDMGAL